jgi:hydroxypyruvate isomerase
MPRFAANLSMMFNEVPFLERFGRAAAAGFRGVEYLSPYEHEPAEIADALAAHDLCQVLFNMAAGDWDGGERGIAALPGREAEFEGAVETAIRYAQALDCQLLHCMAGIVPPEVDPVEAERTYIHNLDFAARRLADAGRTLLIEPINHRDVPGYLLSRQDHARGILTRSKLDNLRIQFDVYHCQIVHGDLTRWMEALFPMIGHVQIADVPDRHEPGTGEINFRHVLATLDRLGYDGWVGCEYRPAGVTEDGLSWLHDFDRPKNQKGT